MSEEQVVEIGDTSDPQQSVKAAISREMLRLYERKLVAMGELDRIRDMRTYFQHATAGDFCEAVERLLGRKIRGFTSGTDVTRDISSETFYLERAGESNGEIDSAE